MVNAKLHLEAVLGGPVRAAHHGRVVDQDVNMLLLWKGDTSAWDHRALLGD